MASSKKIEANKKNAQKSTGPKTETGKAHSCLNAFQIGIYTQMRLLPNEDERQYDAIADAVDAEFDPVGIQQNIYATQLVDSIWRLARLEKAERVALLKAQTRMHLQDNCGVQMHSQDAQGAWHYEYDDPAVETMLRGIIETYESRVCIGPRDIPASDDPPGPKLPSLGSTFLETFAPRSKNAYAELDRLRRKYMKIIEHCSNELRADKERRTRRGEIIDVISEVSPAPARRVRSKEKPKAAAHADIPTTVSTPRNPGTEAIEPQLDFDMGSIVASSVAGGASAPPPPPPH